MMQATKNILVAVNVYDHDADQVLSFAKQFALSHGMSLHVLYVVQHLCSSGLRCRLNQARHEVSTLVAQYNLEKANIHIRVGRVKSLVVEESVRLQSARIIIGTQKLGWYRFTTPVAELLKQEAACGVVSVQLVDQAESVDESMMEDSVVNYA